MSDDFSSPATARHSIVKRGGIGLGLVAWVITGFFGSQLIMAVVLTLFGGSAGQDMDAMSVVDKAVFAAAIYALSVFVVVGAPGWIWGRMRTTGRQLGVFRLPAWSDIGLGLLSVVPYVVLSLIGAELVKVVFPGVQLDEVQDVGFRSLTQSYEYVLAFITLVVVAPIAEEVLFRGYLYGKLRNISMVLTSIVVTSLLFAFVHLQINVGIDVFAMSIVACVLREYTRNIWAGIVLHMAKNAIAYYLLFIYVSR